MQDFNYFTTKRLEYQEKANSYLRAGDKENYYLNRRKSLMAELLGYQEIGCNETKIWTAQDNLNCRLCRKMHGQKLTINDALANMPIPVKNCPSRMGYCRCDYLPIARI